MLLFPTKSLSIDAGRTAFEVRAFPEALQVTMVDTSYRPPQWKLEIFPIGEEDRVDREDPVLRWSRLYFPEMDDPIHYVSMRAWVPTAMYLAVWLGGLAAWQLWRKRRSHGLSLEP
ncbi:hypothetical protein [Haloferula sp. BvORR071]|uniref:hypothetical protein n=1 Tax=Haloferula sp. BvORR071 TaxID=1396141 RepID=UPI00055406E9|nr:hypothetical protein [Haloferula sp. BvORR071]